MSQSTPETVRLTGDPAVCSTDLLYRGTWTTCALNAGGRLTVEQVVKGKTIFRAQMDWPGEKPVRGKIAMSTLGALINLEAALTDDCANDMLKSGAV